VTAAGAARAPYAAIGGRALTVALLVVVAYSVSHGTLYAQSLVLTAAVFAILALSLDLVAGVTGLYSLGHAGLFALGAYGTALLNDHRGWNVFVLLPVVMAGTGLVGLVLGTLSLRVGGLYFAITTFVFTLVVGVLASDLKITGGLQGVEGPIFPEFPLGWSALGSALTWCVMAALGLTVYLVWAIRRSALYPVLLAIRDAEPFAAAAGVRTEVMKVALFGLSAALAGMAGWCFSFLGFISPGQFAWTVSVNILVMVILGGINTTAGPIVGAVFVSVFPAYVHFSPLWQEVLFGALFVVVIIFFPQGFMGLVAAGVRRLRRDQGPPPEAPAPPRDLHATIQALAGRADAPATEGNAVECRGITFGYVQGIRALNDVDLTVRRGTIHGLIGPNGSGKSTLASIIAGHRRPDAGTITVNGVRVERLGASARPAHGLTRTFQAAVLVKELPVAANVAVGGYSRVPRLGPPRRPPAGRPCRRRALARRHPVVGAYPRRRRAARDRAAHPARGGLRVRAERAAAGRAAGRALADRGRPRRGHPARPAALGRHGDRDRAPDAVRLRRLRRRDGPERGRAGGRRARRRGARARPSARGLPGTMTTNNAEPALEITSLSAGYGRYDVVRDVGLTVGRGEAVALLGPNGAGKTTLLRAVMGMVKHRSGSVRAGGVELIAMPTHRIARGHAALVPEGRRLFLNQSVEDNLRLGGLRLRRDAGRTREMLDSVYELFPVLARYRSRPSSALSGGEQQMVAIGRMMMSDPQVMLLDEPSLGLAPLAIDAVAEALATLRERGRSLLLVEQRIDLALRVCDRLYVLTDGRVATEARAGEVDPERRSLLDAYLG
jgi:branched-chain amino acid transport system ATP-binding protein/branched-chain amino acid transport system permease protein